MRTLFFIHGWPDDKSLWDKQVEYFKDTYHCHTITLPGFGEEEEEHDFPEVVEIIATEIRKLSTPVILVGHDWGAYLSYMVENKYPDLVERVVGLDVGTGGVRSLKDVPFAVTYQMILTGSWLLRKKFPVGAEKVTKSVANFARAPLKDKVQTKKNYLYYYFWRDLLLPQYRKNLLLKYQPKCPLLYIYSESKPLMFHSKGWENYLRKRPDCSIKSIKGSGHWFMYHRPEMINPMIEELLESR